MIKNLIGAMSIQGDLFLSNGKELIYSSDGGMHYMHYFPDGILENWRSIEGLEIVKRDTYENYEDVNFALKITLRNDKDLLEDRYTFPRSIHSARQRFYDEAKLFTAHSFARFA